MSNWQQSCCDRWCECWPSSVRNYTSPKGTSEAHATIINEGQTVKVLLKSVSNQDRAVVNTFELIWITSISFTGASNPCWAFRVPVVRRGEGCHYDILPVDVNDICHRLQDVEVKVGVAGDGTVQPRLEKRSPLFLQDAGRAATVVLTNPGHPRKHHLSETCTGQKLQLCSVRSMNQNGRRTTWNVIFFLRKIQLNLPGGSVGDLRWNENFTVRILII